VVTAVELLKKDLESAKARERAAAEDVARLEAALAALEGPLEALESRRQGQQFVGKGIVEAAKVIVREKGPQSTGDIMRAAIARGWTTTSKKPIAAFYSTLNGSKAFKRSGKKWHLADEPVEARRRDR
jgi:hypothetical protein